MRVSPTEVGRRFTTSSSIRFQGLLTLLAFLSSQSLRAIFQARAFLGFTLQSFAPRRNPTPLSRLVALLPLHRQPNHEDWTARCGFRALLLRRSRDRRLGINQNDDSLLSWGSASLRLTVFRPHRRFHVDDYFVLPCEPMRIRTDTL